MYNHIIIIIIIIIIVEVRFLWLYKYPSLLILKTWFVSNLSQFTIHISLSLSGLWTKSRLMRFWWIEFEPKFQAHPLLSMSCNKLNSAWLISPYSQRPITLKLGWNVKNTKFFRIYIPTNPILFACIFYMWLYCEIVEPFQFQFFFFFSTLNYFIINIIL